MPSPTPTHASVTRRRRATSKEGREGRELSPAENNGEPRRETHKGLRGAGVKDKTDVQAVAEQQSVSLPAGLSVLSEAILFINRSFIVWFILNL